jgi:hypothetical protein
MTACHGALRRGPLSGRKPCFTAEGVEVGPDQVYLHIRVVLAIVLGLAIPNS